MFGLNQNKKGKKNTKKNANININVKKPGNKLSKN